METAERVVAPVLLTQREAARYLGMGERTLKSLVARRQAPRRIGGGRRGAWVRYRPRDLDDWLEERARNGRRAG